MMTRTLKLLLLIVSCLWQVSRSVVLTPRNISACPGEEILVKCNESDTTATIHLRWTLTLKNRQASAAEMTLPRDTQMNANESSTHLLIAEQQLNFLSKLTSYFPLISTFMTTAHPALNDARLTCQSTLSMDTLTIRVPETDQPEIRWLNITGGIFEEENLTAVIKWESNSGCLNFTLILSNDTSINYNITSTTTKNTSHAFEFNVLYNTNYTVTVTTSSGNSSSEISKTFNFVKCEPPPHRENVTISGYVSPALENVQISLSCLPGYSSPDRESTTITSTCTSEATWSPDISLLDLECKPRDCGQLPSNTDVYIILNHTYSTIVGSIIHFECVQTHPSTDLNKTLHGAECLESGLWQPEPQTTCGQTTTSNGNLIRTVALVVTLVCLVCLVGTAAAALSCLVISRKKGSNEEEDDQRYSGSTQTGYNNLGQHYDYLFRAEGSQNRDNHTIEHWGLYSLLSQPEAESTRNSAVYAEVGPNPKGKKAAVVMPDTTLQYAVVKKKRETVDIDMKVVLSLNELLMKIQSQVAPKWHQFGMAVRLPVETLNDLSTYKEEDCLSEIADYWMEQHQGQLTWQEVARIMKEIDLNDLAEEILSVNTGDTGEFQEEDEASQVHQYQTVSELSSINVSDKHEAETNDFITANSPAQSLETDAVS